MINFYKKMNLDYSLITIYELFIKVDSKNALR